MEVWTRLGRDTNTALDQTIGELQWRVLALKRHEPLCALPDAVFEAILVAPAQSELDTLKQPLGLVVVPHGGPHSGCTASYSLTAALLGQAGFATLFINYRGSTGTVCDV